MGRGFHSEDMERGFDFAGDGHPFQPKRETGRGAHHSLLYDEHGILRPSQDWNRQGSHRWNTGGGFDDTHDTDSNRTMQGWGVAGRSGNFIRNSDGQYSGRGPKGYQRSDERINEDICECLTRDPHVDASDIEITVNQGDVTLSGSVSDRWQKHAAEDAIEGIAGVKGVHNRLKVRSNQETSPQAMSGRSLPA